jgi:hypothetical protein
MRNASEHPGGGVIRFECPWHLSCRLSEQARGRSFYGDCLPTWILHFGCSLNPEHSHDVGGGMRRRRVDEILQPYEEGVPLDPCLEMGGRIIDAIQLMVANNLKCLTVTINKRPVGMVRLEDAFKKVGLLVRSQ